MEDPYAQVPPIKLKQARLHRRWTEVRVVREELVDEASLRAIEQAYDEREDWLYRHDLHEGKDWVLRWDDTDTFRGDIYMIKNATTALLFKLTWGGK